MGILPKGENPRYIVGNLPAEGFGEEDSNRFGCQELYEEFYCARRAHIELCSAYPLKEVFAHVHANLTNINEARNPKE